MPYPLFTTKSPLSTKNSLTTPIFSSLQAFALIPQHYFSKYWGGPMHGSSPTSNFFWGRGTAPPPVPLGLRPWSTYFCLQIELDCSSSNCFSKTCNSIQSNIVKYKFFKISKVSGYFLSLHYVVGLLSN